MTMPRMDRPVLQMRESTDLERPRDHTIIEYNDLPSATRNSLFNSVVTYEGEDVIHEGNVVTN